MENEAAKYFIGEIYAGEIAVGFLVCDRRQDSAEPTIDEATARAIVAGCGGSPNVALSSVNLFEISAEEFESYRAAELPAPNLSDGLTLYRVKT